MNPANTASEESAIRRALYNKRYKEAYGGDAAINLGLQMGGAAGCLTYAALAKGGFTMLPYQASKIHKYGMIGGAGFLAFNVGF